MWNRWHPLANPTLPLLVKCQCSLFKAPNKVIIIKMSFGKVPSPLIVHVVCGLTFSFHFVINKATHFGISSIKSLKFPKWLSFIGFGSSISGIIDTVPSYNLLGQLEGRVHISAVAGGRHYYVQLCKQISSRPRWPPHYSFQLSGSFFMGSSFSPFRISGYLHSFRFSPSHLAGNHLYPKKVFKVDKVDVL